MSRTRNELEERVRERTAELTAANDALWRSEEKFRGFLESAPDAIVIVDESGRILLTNSQAEKLFGYAWVEALGRPVEFVVRGRLGAGNPRQRDAFFANPGSRPCGAAPELRGMTRIG